MEKIELKIVGLSYSQTQSGAYALVLSERNGTRRLPIIIGGFEAQSIAIELEKMKPSRPLTHDLFKAFSDSFGIEVKEVVIYNLVEGVFYSKLICEQNGDSIEIDARTSDAIAIGLRCGSPVYTFEHILSSAGIQLEDELVADKEIGTEEEESVAANKGTELGALTSEELEALLKEAIEAEDYEKASQIRDEIKKRN
ncbi:MAG: bifunctional nuclease family protein [Crocinitomicaceae bacterium]|jgi:bifunctional DNase/RNase|nr:bifunctional nuclease family protein [Crocinitomicaceae bacterium]MBK6952334.1 bifunctional nuclease family protein [Crocinitomicaceae bacterium]MBK9591701.1 bifunctional nuclease family protein [Crocinitomicaceae bacterium]